MTQPGEVDCATAEALGGKICAAAGLAAQSECQLLELIGDFDAGNAVRWWDGVKSLAHWLSWACSMSPGTAREGQMTIRHSATGGWEFWMPDGKPTATGTPPRACSTSSPSTPTNEQPNEAGPRTRP